MPGKRLWQRQMRARESWQEERRGATFWTSQLCDTFGFSSSASSPLSADATSTAAVVPIQGHPTANVSAYLRKCMLKGQMKHMILTRQ